MTPTHNLVAASIADLNKQHELVMQLAAPGAVLAAATAALDSSYREVFCQLFTAGATGTEADRELLRRFLHDIRTLHRLGYCYQAFDKSYAPEMLADLFADMPLEVPDFVRLAARVLVARHVSFLRTFPVPGDEAGVRAAAVRALEAVAAQGRNPIEHLYGDSMGTHAWIPKHHALWAPYLGSLSPEFLLRVVQGKHPADLVYFGVHCPHLSENLPPKYRRRFPKFNRLPALLLPAGAAGAVDESDRIDFASWEARGQNLFESFKEFGCQLSKVAQPIPAWNWKPRRIKLPQVSLVIDEHGVRRGNTRIAWRLGPNHLFNFVSEKTVAGRALLSLTENQGLDVYTLQRQEFGGRAFYGEPGEGDRNQLLHFLKLYVFSESFRWVRAHEILDFLSRASDPFFYRSIREEILVQVHYFEKCTLFGSGEAMPQVTGTWGRIEAWVTLVGEHFPDITPHPEITAKIS